MTDPITPDLLRRMVELERKAFTPPHDDAAADEFMDLLWGTKTKPGLWAPIVQLALERLLARQARQRGAAKIDHKKRRKLTFGRAEHRVVLLVYAETCTTDRALCLLASGGVLNTSSYRSEMRTIKGLVRAGFLERLGDQLRVTAKGRFLIENH